MKIYTEPKLEIVTLNAADVITTSPSGWHSLLRTTSIEQGTDINKFSID